jgi:hypothetical protein
MLVDSEPEQGAVSTDDADGTDALDTEEDESTPRPKKRTNDQDGRRCMPVEHITDDDHNEDNFQTPLPLKQRYRPVSESEDMERHYPEQEGRHNKPEEKEAVKCKRDQLAEVGKKKERKGSTKVNTVGVKYNARSQSLIDHPLFRLGRTDYQPSKNVRLPCDADGYRLATNFVLQWQCALFVSPYDWNFST